MIINLLINLAQLNRKCSIECNPKDIFKLEKEREKVLRFLKEENKNEDSEKITTHKTKLNVTN